MSFSNGSQANQAEINVTPLIDVLLVLLIIFMVIVPVMPNGLKALTSQQAAKNTATPPPDATIVLQVQSHAGGPPSYSINQQPIAKEAITAKLTEIFASRQQRTMFVKGDKELEFSSIAEVVGFAHKALVDNIGVLIPGVAGAN